MVAMMLVMVFPLIGLGLFAWLRWTVALPIYLVGVVVSVFYHRAMTKSRAIPVSTGAEGMHGRTGTVTTSRSGRVTVVSRNEIWSARAEDGRPLDPGTAVEVVDLDGLTLVVRPLPAKSGPGRGRRRLTRRTCTPPRGS